MVRSFWIETDREEDDADDKAGCWRQFDKLSELLDKEESGDEFKYDDDDDDDEEEEVDEDEEVGWWFNFDFLLGLVDLDELVEDDAAEDNEGDEDWSCFILLLIDDLPSGLALETDNIVDLAVFILFIISEIEKKKKNYFFFLSIENKINMSFFF